jgi:hypothetical protein
MASFIQQQEQVQEKLVRSCHFMLLPNEESYPVRSRTAPQPLCSKASRPSLDSTRVNMSRDFANRPQLKRYLVCSQYFSQHHGTFVCKLLHSQTVF